MPADAHLTGRGNFLEDFPVGRLIRHPLGRTIGSEHRWMTTAMMNHVQLHFSADFCEKDAFVSERFGGRIIVYGGYVLAICRGLASQDTSENAVAEVGFANGRHKAPIFEGDTLSATSEVAAVEDHGDGTGTVTFVLRGTKQDGTEVLEIERHVRVPKRPG